MKSIKRISLFLTERIGLLEVIKADSVYLYSIGLLIAGYSELFCLGVIKLTLIRPFIFINDSDTVKTVF